MCEEQFAMSFDDRLIDLPRRKLMSAIPALTAAAALGATGLGCPSKASASTPSSSTQSEPSGASPVKVRKIALEEHFMLADFVGYLAETKQNIRPQLFDKALPLLSDFGDRRLETMDRNGIDYVVLSLSGPGVQIEKDTRKAIRLARQANDALAKEVHDKPSRYGGFAHLALQDAAHAADELERCVKQLGFKGALINGATNGLYLDDRRYDVFWERVQALQVPVYIHPANPTDHPAMYADHPEMWGPTWSWAVETCSHAMRLIFSGTFDRYPQANIILGHMGETLPIQLSRLDSRYPISNQKYQILKKPSEYVRQNVYITTSGVCSDAALRCSIDALGLDKVMFSIDYPFEQTETASAWIDSAQLSNEERVAVAGANAVRLMRI
jgi:2,3-dihydroxybenzoate decarboxylase